MSVTQKPEQFQANESPIEGDFIWPPDIKWQIHKILTINEDDYDENLIELVKMKYPQAWEYFSENDNGGVKKVFSDWKYIRLQRKDSNTLDIDMIQMPWQWNQAMLEIFTYCIENNIFKLTWKIQPQKKPFTKKSSSERRKQVLMDAWSNFGFSNLDGTNIELIFSEDNKRVLVNKIKYYLEKWKWFKS